MTASGSRWGAAAFTVGTGLAVIVGAGTAGADDNATGADDAGAGKQAATRAVRSATSPAVRPATAPRTRPSAVLAPALPSAATSTTAITVPKTPMAAATPAKAAQDPFTSALAAIGREVNRLFFNHTPTANPRIDTPTLPGGDRCDRRRRRRG